MYSKIEQNAEGISLQAEKVEENKQSLAKLQVTADGIQSEVKTLAGTDEQLSTKITQTANLITSEVEKLNNKDTELSTKINQTAESINLQATKIEENTSKVADLSVKAGEISSMTKVNISAYFEKDEAPTKENTSTAQKAMLCLYKGVHYYYNDITEEWEVYPQTGLKTLFVQDGDGFKIYGDVKIDGSCILTESLVFNSSDKPIQVIYSKDGQTNWHSDFDASNDKFMKLMIGANWSDAIKIVGDDGLPGPPGAGGAISYETISGILDEDYKISSTSLGYASIASPQIHSAKLYSPNIYGENITLTMKNENNDKIYNNMKLTPTGMSLTNAYNNNEKEKFALDLSEDDKTSYVLMRLGTGTNAAHQDSLILEKYSDYIKIGSDTTSSKGFVGFTITPSSGELKFYGNISGITAQFG